MPSFLSKKHFAFWLFVFFLLSNLPKAQADCDLFPSINPVEAVECVMTDLGFDKAVIQNTATYFNVSEKKRLPPQVTLVFSPPNPVPGEKVTASALPINFGNQADSQYFTWYLQTADCPPRNNIGSNYAKCDLNGDGDVDIEDYKIKAMRAYASAGFDWESVNYDATANNADNDGYHAILGGNDQKGKDDHCFFYNTSSGDFTELTWEPLAGDDRVPECFHLFPRSGGTGDGEFNTAEEKIWHTNPDDPDTAGTGHPDEANVAGLGAKDFAWTYKSGDKLGVVVEGIATEMTSNANSSYKITWAFLNGTCSNFSVNTERSNFNGFNKCLQKNMLAPAEGGGKNEKIDVSLSFSPTNPVNDTSSEGDNSDWINVVSAIGNSTNIESLHYVWTVYAGNDSDVDVSWGSPLNKEVLLGVGQTVGAGIPNLKFKANFSGAPQYLKVKLNVSERIAGSSAEAGTRLGYAAVVIPLSSFKNRLSVFNTEVSDSLILSKGNQELCKTYGATNKETLTDAAVCQVAPDEIIAVKADIAPENDLGETTLEKFDFLWTLNGAPLSYQYDPLHAEENFQPGDLIHFPVLAAKNTSLNLSLVATSQESGRKISLTKTFVVSEPAFKINSGDENTAQPKLLGYYIDLDGKEWPDYSQTEFLALADKTIQLELFSFFTSPFPDADDLPITWSLNGSPLETIDRFLSLTGITESSFSVEAKGLYTQDLETKKALHNYWGVSLNEFYEKQISQKIDFTLTDVLDAPAGVAQKSQGKIMASFISNVPAYFAFLFRLVMTAFVLLSAVWILFVLFPQTERE